MTKSEFLCELRKALSGLPVADIEERISFYSEMIDDRVEEGFTVEEAIAEIGSVNKIKDEVIKPTPLVKIIAEKIKPRKKAGAWEIILLVLGAPIWLSLIIAAFAVALSLYVSVWSVVISLWSVFASFVGCALAGVVGFFILAATGNLPSGLFLLGCGLVLSGLILPTFNVCKFITDYMIRLTKLIAVSIKKRIVKNKKEAGE